MIFFRVLSRYFMSGKSSKLNLENYAKTYEAPIYSNQMDLSKDKVGTFNEVIKTLNDGGCVAVPTDTVYGLVTLLKFSPKLFLVKKRLPTKPIGLFIHSSQQIKRYAIQTVDDTFLQKLLPGKVTLLFKRIPEATDAFLFNTDLIGFRIPEDEFIQKVCQQFDEPLAQTSANLSGEPSAIKPEEFSSIWETLNLIVVDTDRKMDKSREGSTIIDLSEPGTYQITRNGCSLSQYEKILRDSNLKRR